MRTRATELQREVSARRQEAALLSVAASEKIAAAAAQSKRIADARSLGVSDQRIYSMREVERRLKAEAAEINNKIRVMDKETSAMVAEIRMLDRQSSELERSHRLRRQLAQGIVATGAALGTIGVGLLGAGAAISYFFIQSFKSFQEYQRQVALTHTQIDGFTASLKDVSEIGLRVANEIPVAFEQIQPALFDIFSSTNANLAQSEMLLRSFSKAAVAGQTDIQTAARGTLAIMNGLNIPFERVNEVLDVQFELVRKGVGTYEEFAKVFGRIIPAANRSQQSFETVAAMLAFMTRNGQSAAQAATAAARALELFTHPKAVQSLQAMGVKVQDLKGNYLPLIDILKQLRVQLLRIPQSDRVATLVDMFKGAGFNIQARRFLEQVVLGAGELENFEDLLKSMGSAAGVMGDKYGEMADTAASKTQLLANRWETLKVTFGEAVAPVLLKIMALFSQLLNWFNNLSPATKKMVTNVMLVATALSIVGGVALIFLGILAGIVAAVVAAGTEILIIIGVLVGLATGVGAVTAALGLAWIKSEQFRSIVRDMVTDARNLWKEIETLGGKVRSAFKTYGAPALERLQDIIETRVLPALRIFQKEVADIMMPKIVEAFRLIGGYAESALQFIGKVINDYVIPAVTKLADWWGKNKKEIMPFIEAAAQMVKWFLIIAAVIVGSGIVGGILVIIATVGVLVGTFMAIVEVFKFVKSAIGSFIDFLTSSASSGTSAVSDTWNSFWTTVVGMFTSTVDFLRSIWEAFWAAFGEPIKAAWELTKATIDLGITIALLPIRAVIEGLRQIWEATWSVIGGTVKSTWEGINNVSKTMRDTAVDIWNTYVAMVKDTWNTVVHTVTDALEFLQRFFTGWRDRIINTFISLSTNIRDFFKNLALDLYNSGSNIVDSLIDGITSKMKKLTDKIKEITQKIKDFFPSSPAKTGPLSGSGSPFKSGQAIADMLAAGMMYQTEAVRSASLNLADAVTPIPNLSNQSNLAPVALGASTGSPFMPTKTNNVTVNVYTNEIDPRATATELGFELEGKL
jgi:TP901 family phage tail tape measure protein